MLSKGCGAHPIQEKNHEDNKSQILRLYLDVSTLIHESGRYLNLIKKKLYLKALILQ